MQGKDQPTELSAVELDETALEGVQGAGYLKFSPGPTTAARKAGGGQPGVISDPEDGSERA